ncbi:class I SAM-dependent methyltransferase [Paenibacillus hodogayensis]|uniref:Class I SAM-dependent methyltransferase n=1 Tax=Paenibacillus hodogayensis TaxID=279208 RepID=A0ABV5VUN7_9BACL
MSDSLKELVKQQFSKNASSYVTSARHARGEDLALLVSAAEANRDMEVLDIATGGGHVANALAPLVCRVVASDLTPEMLEAAAAFIRGNGHENVDFIPGDAERLPFADAAFDLVTCRIAAHHFPDVSAFVRESFRVVKPGGKLLLIDNTAPEADDFDRFYNEIEKLRDPSHVRAWKKSEWLGMLEAAGYRLESLVCFPKPFQFRDWCARASVPEQTVSRLANDLANAPEPFRRRFSIQTDEAGAVTSFQGEAVYVQAVKPV